MSGDDLAARQAEEFGRRRLLRVRDKLERLYFPDRPDLWHDPPPPPSGKPPGGLTREQIVQARQAVPGEGRPGWLQVAEALGVSEATLRRARRYWGTTGISTGSERF